LNVSGSVGLCNQITKGRGVDAFVKPRFSIRTYQVDLADSVRLSDLIKKLVKARFPFFLQDLSGRSREYRHLIADRNLPTADDRLRLDGPVQENNGPDHQGNCCQEPKKDLKKEIHG